MMMILACMFLFTALCLDLAYHKEKVQIRDIAVLMALMAAAGPCEDGLRCDDGFMSSDSGKKIRQLGQMVSVSPLR